MAEYHLTLENVDLLAKADLLNECARLELSTSGTKKELRDRLCSHLGLVKSNDSDRSSGSKQEASELLTLVNWMNQQNERRFEQMLELQREQMAVLVGRLSPGSSLKGSDECTIHTVRRSVNRLKGEANSAMQTMRCNLQEAKGKEVIKSSLNSLHRLEQRFETLLDQKVDCLDGNEEKDELLEEIHSLQDKLRKLMLRADVYIAELERTEREKAKAGPLPPNVDIPTFDGNPVSFPAWWDHFRTLVHENPQVSPFWKMRYLLKALTGSAAFILASKQGLADEYLDSIESVTKRYGSPCLLVRHLVNSIVNQTPPLLKDLSTFVKFLEVMKTHLASLDMHGATKDMIFLPLLEAKLPVSIRKAWERKVCSIIDQEDCPSPKDLLKFCESEYEALNSVECNSSSMVAKPTNVFHKRIEKKSTSRPFSAQTLIVNSESNRSTEFTQRKEKKCVLCNKPHSLKSCSSFLTRTKEERRKLITENKHCFKCIDVKFSAGHRCSYLKCAFCSTPHHELLSCREKNTTDEEQGIRSSKGLVVVSNEGDEILPTVLAKAVSGEKEVVV